MKKLISWLLTFFVIGILIILTNHIFLYGIIYQSVIKDSTLKNGYKENNYEMIQGNYVPLFEELEVEEGLFNDYNLSSCKTTDTRLICGEDFYIFKGNDNMDLKFNDIGNYEIHKFYLVDASVVGDYFKTFSTESVYDSYSELGKSEFKKVNFFNSQKQIKQAILHNYLKINHVSQFGTRHYVGDYLLITNEYNVDPSNVDHYYSMIINGHGDYYYYMQTKNYDLFKSLIGRIKTSE